MIGKIQIITPREFQAHSISDKEPQPYHDKPKKEEEKKTEDGMVIQKNKQKTIDRYV